MSQHTTPAVHQDTPSLLREALNVDPRDFEHDNDPAYDEFRLWFIRWRDRLAELEPYL